MPKSEAVRHLKRVRDQIQNLEEYSTDSPVFIEWRRGTRIALENVFGKDSDEVDEFGHVNFFPPSIGISVIGSEAKERARNERWRRESYKSGLIRSKSLLNSMIEQVKTYGQNDDKSVTSHGDPKDTEPISPYSPNSFLEAKTMKVFISHSSKDERLVSSIVALIVTTKPGWIQG